jgi:hypothetical protein
VHRYCYGWPVVWRSIPVRSPVSADTFDMDRPEAAHHVRAKQHAVSNPERAAAPRLRPTYSPIPNAH